MKEAQPLTPAQLVAETIRQQIGRGAFAMLGSDTFVTAGTEHAPGLRFNVKGSKVANTVEVLLMPNDTYTVTFYKVPRAILAEAKLAKLVPGLHAEDLKRVLRDVLKLEVSL